MVLFIAGVVGASDDVVTPDGDGIVSVVLLFSSGICCNDGHGSGSSCGGGRLNLFLFLLFHSLSAVFSSINTQGSFFENVGCVESIINHHIGSIGGIGDWWHWGLGLGDGDQWVCNDWKQFANE